MATSSDGGDNYIPSSLTNTLNNGTSSDLRFFLQNLLDDKEKQLQHAGTLGQQLLAQRVELDDTVRMMLDMVDAGDGDDVRDKLAELEGTMRVWDADNEQLSIAAGLKVRRSLSSWYMLECEAATGKASSRTYTRRGSTR